MIEPKEKFWNALIGSGVILLLVVGFASRLLGVEPVAYLEISEVEVIDGDTIKAVVHLGGGVNLDKQSIRAVNYDAWESRRFRRSKPFSSFTDQQWEAEVIKGKVATNAVSELIASGKLFVVLESKRDTYGRLLGRFYVYRNGNLFGVADELKRGGHTRR